MSDSGFVTPETNAFGQTFRYLSSVKAMHMQTAYSYYCIKEVMEKKQIMTGTMKLNQKEKTPLKSFIE